MTTDTQLMLDGGPEPVSEPTPMLLLANAVQSGVPVESLERLTALAERWQEAQGREAFGLAIASFQSEMPAVAKTRKADRYQYAGFDDIMAQASPILSKYGIAIGFDSEQQDNGLKVTARIRVGSYHEDRSFACPIPSTLSVSESQQYGAALSYAKRYCLCAALNIVVTDEDNERQLTPPIEKGQVKEINDLIKASGRDLEKFLGWLGIASISEMTSRDYKLAKPVLEAAVRKGAGDGSDTP